MDAEAWDERYAATELVWSAGPNQFVAAECAELPPGRALDLAAGEGRNAIWLARRGWTVTAVDFSQVALDKGRAVARDVEVDVEWVCDDATTWRRDAAFDLAVIAYLQVPADDRRAAIGNAFASLAPGGTLLVVGHDSANLTEGTGGPQDPAVLYTADDLLVDLAGVDGVDGVGGREGSAYDVVRAGRVEREVAQPDGTAIALDVLLRLVRVA